MSADTPSQLAARRKDQPGSLQAGIRHRLKQSRNVLDPARKNVDDLQRLSLARHSAFTARTSSPDPSTVIASLHHWSRRACETLPARRLAAPAAQPLAMQPIFGAIQSLRGPSPAAIGPPLINPIDPPARRIGVNVLAVLLIAAPFQQKRRAGTRDGSPDADSDARDAYQHAFHIECPNENSAPRRFRSLASALAASRSFDYGPPFLCTLWAVGSGRGLARQLKIDCVEF